MKRVLSLFLIVAVILGALTACGKAPIKSESKPTGKLVINMEGIVTAVDGDEITLDNGTSFVISSSTIFSVYSGVVKDLVLAEGNQIQGYVSEDGVATRVHLIQ